jgi:hypothetical protein
MAVSEHKVRPAAKTATKKPATKKAATNKIAVTKTAAKKTAVTKTAVKKTAVKNTTGTKTATKKTATKKPAVNKSAAKKTAAKKPAAKKPAAKKTSAKKPATKKTAAKKTAAKKPAKTGTAANVTAGGASGAPVLATELRRCLVMLLRHSEPFGRALTRKLKALDPYDDSEEREAAALALVDAVQLPPELLAKVTELTSASVEDINLVYPYWDGESDPFPLASLSELLALPNLERLANPSALPDPPLDARPLLALSRLRHVEMWESHYCYRGSQYGLWTNKKAIALLESAGFRRVPSPPGTICVLERS